MWWVEVAEGQVVGPDLEQPAAAAEPVPEAGRAVDHRRLLDPAQPAHRGVEQRQPQPDAEPPVPALQHPAGQLPDRVAAGHAGCAVPRGGHRRGPVGDVARVGVGVGGRGHPHPVGVRQPLPVDQPVAEAVRGGQVLRHGGGGGQAEPAKVSDPGSRHHDSALLPGPQHGPDHAGDVVARAAVVLRLEVVHLVDRLPPQRGQRAGQRLGCELPVYRPAPERELHAAVARKRRGDRVGEERQQQGEVLGRHAMPEQQLRAVAKGPARMGGSSTRATDPRAARTATSARVSAGRSGWPGRVEAARAVRPRTRSAAATSGPR